MRFESFPSLEAESDEPMIPSVPHSEIKIFHARSSGPGGQNVNKSSTKAIIKWRVNASKTFTEEQKEMITDALASRINKDGCVVIRSDALRSQNQNEESAINLLQRLVVDALTPQKERKPTKPTRASRERRLDEKALVAKKKEFRRFRGNED